MTTLTIGPNLGIENAAELRAALLKPARSKGAVTIAVEHIDKLHTAALQVLCAFMRERTRVKATTRIDAPEELRTAASLLGVAQTLGFEETAP